MVHSVRIVYGLPGPEMFEAAERGEILLGGCVIGPDSPTTGCPACGHRFSTRGERDADRSHPHPA